MSSSIKPRAPYQFGMPVRPVPIGANSWDIARVPCHSPLNPHADTYAIPCLSPYGHAVVEISDRIKRVDYLLAAFSLSPGDRISFVAQLQHGPGATGKLPFSPIVTRLTSRVILELRPDRSLSILLNLQHSRHTIAILTPVQRSELGRLLGDLRFVEFDR